MRLLILRTVAYGTTAATAALLGGGVYASYQVNVRRKRYYTDDFHMTPETLSMPFEGTQFTTSDGVVLRGWWIRQSRNGVPSKRAIVLCNPYNSDKSNLLGIARGLWDAGNSVFMFDNRSHASTPTKQTVGHLEQLDARAAVDALALRICDRATGVPSMRIGFCGASMGGAMAIITAHSLPSPLRDAVCGVVSDCAFCDFDSELEYRIVHAFPAFPAFLVDTLMVVTRAFNKFWYGWNFADVSPIAAVANRTATDVDIPLLIVHSDGDHVVPVSHAQRIFDAAKTPNKSLWIIPGCDHVGGYFQDSHTYNRRVVDFFEGDVRRQREALKKRAAPRVCYAAPPPANAADVAAPEPTSAPVAAAPDAAPAGPAPAEAAAVAKSFNY